MLPKDVLGGAALLFTTACAGPSYPTTPTRSPSAPESRANFADADVSWLDEESGAERQDGSSEPASVATASDVAPCEAEMELPAQTGYGDVVVVLPKNVELQQVTQFAWKSSGVVSTCDVIASVWMVAVEADEGPNETAMEVLRFIGLEDGQYRREDEELWLGKYEGTYEAPAANGNPPGRGFVRAQKLKAGGSSMVFVIVLEAHPNAFPAIEPSFRASRFISLARERPTVCVDEAGELIRCKDADAPSGDDDESGKSILDASDVCYDAEGEIGPCDESGALAR